MIRWLVDRFIDWAVKRAPHEQPVATFDGKPLFTRFEFLWPDEWPDSWWDRQRNERPVRPNSLPWWRPFNAFVHRWDMEQDNSEGFHDHPRWSITICLRGRLIERSPWGERTLRPGSIVLRSHRAIHEFSIPEGYVGDTWTLFIVGRRKHRQNTYIITRR